MPKIKLDQTSLTQALESLIGQAPDSRQINEIRIFTEDYLSRLKDLEPLVGAGTPNSNVVSNSSRQYFDTDTSTLYFNPDVGVDTGWV